MRTQRGFNLIELMIAVAIFGTMMTMVVQATQGARSLIDPDASRDHLTEEGNRAISTIVADLSSTAWFYDWDDANDNGEVDNGETISYRLPWVNPAWKTTATTIAEQSAIDIDGHAVAPTISANGTQSWPNEEAVLTKPYGSRLAFFRLQNSTALRSTPTSSSSGILSFDDPAQAPVRMSRFPDGPPIPGLVLNEAATPGSETNFVSQRWESNRTNSWTDNREKQNLRCFIYTFERSPVTGMGRLVRRYRNATTAWETPLVASSFLEDTVICDWVQCIRFDTWRSLPSLNANQIRVVLLLRHNLDDGTGQSVKRRFEVTVAMRSITYED